MTEQQYKRQFAAVTVAAAFYSLVGIVFAAPTHHMRAWRLAAWVVSAAAFAAHLAYEHFRLRTPPRSGAPRVGLGAALGALGLAVAANIHSLAVPSTDHHRQLLLLALAVWPAMTFLPAWLAALASGWVLARFASGTPSQTELGIPPSPPR